MCFSCSKTNSDLEDHFANIGKVIEAGKGAVREVPSLALSRYVCYLIVQNADPGKQVIALGQTYFAVKTRQQELSEDYEKLTKAKSVKKVI